jgi:large conductance mechanosensitive channel
MEEIIMWKDFKEFAFQGNVLDLAVAVIIGAAFGKIVTSLVENVIMPIIGGIFAGVSFEHLHFTIGGSEVLYGSFIQSVFDFIVIAASIFLFVRLLMKFKRNVEEEEEEVVEVDAQEELLTEIRDLLKEQNTRN